MTRSVHCLLRASAGTGKTFRLSSRFLELLLAGVEPERVLATTFTRKAAGEILDRVLERLHEAATDPEKLAELRDSLRGVEVDAQDCARLLAQLTRRIDRFKIRTLDSFFVHVAQLFSLDLGLTPGWTILEEADDVALREEAISELIEGSERERLVELLRALSKSRAARAVRASLDRVVKSGRAAFLESRAEAWECFDPGPEPGPGELDVLRASLDGYPLPRTKAGKPDGRFVKALATLSEKLDARDWSAVLEKGLGSALLEDKGYYGIEVDEATLRPVVDHAIAHLLRDLARRNAAIHELLAQFEGLYDERKAALGGYRFEDVPARIAPLGSRGFDKLSERELDMWFRLDGRIDHLLLDEFQDTAPVQWRILERLADEMLAEGDGERSLFVVGDVKQSIYDWRGAEPRLFDEVERSFRAAGPAGSIETLQKSWRSSRIVLETVNRVFGDLERSAAFDEGPRADAAAQWSTSFEPHEAARELPGAAYLVEVPHEDGASATGKEEAVLRVAMDRVAEIVREAPHCTVGILLRRNTHISRCINLLRERGVRASGEGGNKLVDSALVQQLLSLLHLADHPGDTLAAYHVATSPVGRALGLPDGASDTDRGAFARDVRRRLVEGGYGAFLADVVRTLDAKEPDAFGAWDRRRVAQLLELAFEHDARAGTRPSDFVRIVREERVEDPSAARVKVMTVHASKGLEFDAVVLPELNGTAFKTGDFVSRRDPDALTEPLLAVSAQGGELLMRSRPALEALWTSDQQRSTHEFLSLLYVAMTRAAHRLDLVVQPPPKSGTSLTAARLLRETLSGDADGASDDGVLWSHPESDASWWPEPKAAAEEPRDAAAGALRLGPPAHAVERARPSGEDAPTVRRGARLLEPRPHRAALRGRLLHRWFEEIEWLEEFDADDARLLALGRAITRDEEFAREALAEFRRALEAPDVRALLTRGGREVEAVWRERSFSSILPDASGREALWNGTFDRVVIAEGEVELVDFKTDAIAPDEAPARAREHAAQLDAYARVLGHMLAPREPRIARRVAFVPLGVIVTL